MSLSPLYGAAAGVVGSLFHRNSGLAEKYQGNADSALAGIRQNADASQNVGNIETGAGLDDLKAYQNARQEYLTRLRQPQTSQMTAAQIAQGLGGAQTQANRYRSELAANLAHRGIQTADSGGASGALVGGLANIDSNLYATDSAARERANNLNVQRADHAAEVAAGTYGNDSANEIGRGQSAYNSATGAYDTYAGRNLGEAATAQAADNAYNSGIDAISSGLGTYLGGLGSSNPSEAASPVKPLSSAPLPYAQNNTIPAGILDKYAGAQTWQNTKPEVTYQRRNPWKTNWFGG